MIQPVIYTIDDGLTYKIDFYRTKDNINLEHYKTVKYITLADLLKLRNEIEKITIKFTNDNSNSHHRS